MFFLNRGHLLVEYTRVYEYLNFLLCCWGFFVCSNFFFHIYAQKEFHTLHTLHNDKSLEAQNQSWNGTVTCSPWDTREYQAYYYFWLFIQRNL